VNLRTIGCADAPPDRAGAVPYGQAGKNALRFPHLAHRSAAAHKLHSATATSRIEFDSGKGETLQPATGLSLFFPEPVQTTGTTAFHAPRVRRHGSEGGISHERRSSYAGDDDRSSTRRVCRCRLHEGCSGSQSNQRDGRWSKQRLSVAVHDRARGIRHRVATPLRPCGTHHSPLAFSC
jgi:hypothetical protein